MNASDLPPVLEVRDVRKHFTLHLRDGLHLPVLEGVSLQVHGGECVALVGASGRGKSTLMKCLYGSYHIAEGAVRLLREGGDWLDIAQAKPQDIIELRRRELAYVSQFLRAVPRVGALDIVAQRLLEGGPRATEAPQGAARQVTHETAYETAHETVHETAQDAALEAARDQVRALFTRLHLPSGLWNLPPATFSGGEQQRVNIARGLVLPSRLLLLDEPTASLDAANRAVVIELIHEAKARGTAVVGIFHDEEVRAAVADRCIAL